jgi:hypothetical protein
VPPHFQGKTMKEPKTWIIGVAGGLAMTTLIIVGLNAYVTQIQASAARPVVEMEAVEVTGATPQAQPAFAETEAKKPASL